MAIVLIRFFIFISVLTGAISLVSCESRDMEHVANQNTMVIRQNHQKLQKSTESLVSDVGNETELISELIELSEGLCSNLSCIKYEVTYSFKSEERMPITYADGEFNLSEIAVVGTDSIRRKGFELIVQKGLLYGEKGEIKKGSVVRGRIAPLNSEKIDSVITTMFLQY